MSEEGRFTIHLDHLNDYQFQVKFDWEAASDQLLDEPAPLGEQKGPNASRMLAAALGNCLSASLLHCAAREDIPTEGIKTTVTCRIIRNERKRLRVGGLDVRISVNEQLEQSPRMKRCLDLFEDFCVVTAAVRDGIPVGVEVVNEKGEVLAKE